MLAVGIRHPQPKYMSEPLGAYAHRIIDQELQELLKQLPAILLEGAKGVGKTSTASRLAASVIRLDDEVQRGLLQADMSLLLQKERPILIDEWQRYQPVFDTVRRAVDEDPRPNQFLLTGSAGPANPHTHSGAGRIPTLRMRPLSLAERGMEAPTVSLKTLLAGATQSVRGETPIGLTDYTREILQSGFPGIRRFTGRALRLQLNGYVERIVDRDFEEASQRRMRAPYLLKRWLGAYAAAVSTTASQETIRDAATGGEDEKPSRTSTRSFREVLEQMWIVEPVPAWVPSANPFTPLVQAPKHQLVDPSLAARIHGLDEEALLEAKRPSNRVFEDVPVGGLLGPRSGMVRDGLWLGRLFESLVTQSVRVYSQAAEATVCHMRTSNGRQEIDLIVVRPDRRVLAIEVKLGAVVHDDDVKHLLWLKSQLGPDVIDMVVINTGPQAYRRKDGVAVVPAALLGP